LHWEEGIGRRVKVMEGQQGGVKVERQMYIFLPEGHLILDAITA